VSTDAVPAGMTELVLVEDEEIGVESDDVESYGVPEGDELLEENEVEDEVVGV